MKLKYIELYGFKSFAEKTKLSFNKDITAIVGPNGSGKSNIADAIKWVLGEQSPKSLRGANMQDVIFSGTDTKKPMNMAQVSLILDNSDKSLPIAFEEVNVTRRVYRTGESEYLINKSPVRLKDIKELFLDTGIGKDGYSMIGQGRIDEILNGRNEDRRYIFEEAVGISKNKYKKSEAERKLIKNEENLEYLAKEIKIKQQEVDILEKQSNNAKEGIKLTSRLEILELNLLVKSINKINDDLIKDKADLEYIEKDLLSSTEELDNLNQKIYPVKTEIEELNKKIENLKEEVNNSEKKQQNIDSEVNLNTEKLRFYDLDIKRLNQDIETKEKRITELSEKIKLKKEDYDKLNNDKNNLNKNIKEQNNQVKEYKKKIEKFSKNIEDLDIQLSDYKVKLSNLKINKSTKEQLDTSNEKLKVNYENEISNLISIIEDRDIKISDLQNKISYINDKLNKNTSKISQEIEKREKLNINIIEIEEELNKFKNEYLRLESKRDILERQYKSYDGYYKSVQNLLKISDKNPDIKNRIIGVLADLIQVDDEYKNAFDVALGSSLQNIVIDNEEDGKYLINFIKQQNIGRITFLPVKKIKGIKNNISHPKAIDTLNNLVKYDKRIENIIDYFLSKTILVKNMDDAISVSRQVKGYRIITLEGEVINSWGSMIGGNTFRKESNSLLNRKKEIQDIKKEIDLTKKSIDDSTNKYNDNKNLLDDTMYNLSNFDNQNKELLSEKNSINSLIQEISIEKNFNIKRKEEFENLLKNINKELQDKDFSDIDKIEKIIIDLELERSKLSSNLEINSDENLEIERELIKNNSNLDVVLRDISIIENDLQDLEINLEETEANIINDKNNLQFTIDEINKSKANIEKSKDNSENITKELIISKENIIKLEEKLNSLKMQIQIDSNRIDVLNKDISDYEKEKFKLELRIDNSESKVLHLKTDYMETYSLDEITLEDKLSRLEIVEATRKEVLMIKNRLSEIGYFNFETIEQYSVMFEELEFMKSQYEDLVNTRNDILKMIKDIEKDMIEKFNTYFYQIQKRFDEIFNILFNGGQAELKLDSDDVLTAGIEIIVRPPGKKLTNLALLSGGEKALTAVALLFAIFEINPAPFCVLDEIDAALDEGNIKRYFDYLQSLVDKSQFIIITHRKVSMEMADILYGITMEEKGISKVITLMLEDFK